MKKQRSIGNGERKMNSFKLSALNSGLASVIIYPCFCACLQLLTFHSGMQIHEMWTAILFANKNKLWEDIPNESRNDYSRKCYHNG